MTHDIDDKIAIKFSIAFYDALGAGKSIQFAYKLGCNTLQMMNLSESALPKLKFKEISSPSVELPDARSPIDLRLHYRSGTIEKFIGHYQIVETLSDKGVTTVYKALDTILNRTVALKVLDSIANHPKRKRFYQEARIASALEHPHIVRTYQVGQTDSIGLVYIAMELIEGQSLSKFLEIHKTLNIIDCCCLLMRIAYALAYAHKQGVIHRDVKPSNILLRRATVGTPHSIHFSNANESFIPLLADFGIAQVLNSPELTLTGQGIGTPIYMSPEQGSGRHKIDERSDIYSLGIVMYECLVGRPPFTGSIAQTLHGHTYEAITIPADIIEKLPISIIEILQKSLPKEPQSRYNSVEQMAEDLAAVLRRDSTTLT